MVYNVKVFDNAFVVPDEADSLNIGIVEENSDKTSMAVENNVFIGGNSDYFVGGITEQNNDKLILQ